MQSKHNICVSLCFLLLFYTFKCDSQPSIVIIGAGPSGIAAATRLLKNNFTNIKIIEAENRIGGRINSVKFGDAYVDLGAEWCHGEENNIVYSLAKDLDVLYHTEMNDIPVSSDGHNVKKAVLDDLSVFMDTIYHAGKLDPDVEEKCARENSVGKCFKELFNSSFVSKYQSQNDIKSALGGLSVLRGYISSMESATDWDDVALRGSERQVCGGDFFLNWNGLGYKTILEILMQKYPPGQTPLPIEDKFVLNKEVTRISNWDKNDINTEIKCRDGTTYNAEHVIFTPSLGVLKATYDILFNPKLPSVKVGAIKNIGFGAVAKVFMHFPEKWWNEDTTWIFFWTADDIKNLNNVYSKAFKNGKPWLTYLNSIMPAENNPNVLIAWYSENVFPEIEEISDEDLLESHKYILNRFLGKKYNVTIPDKILRSKWYSNPHFLGTYSYPSAKGFATGGTKFRQKLAEPLLNKDERLSVQFAGEATNPTHHSTVHGAIESGFREADRIVNFYNK